MAGRRRLFSALAVLNAIAGSPAVSETQDLAFGPGARDKLDIYTPRRRRAPCPLVVFCYGGGWESGERRDYRFVGTALASRGFVVAIPDYRVYPEVLFPGFVEDVARAVGWLRSNAERFGGDSDRLVLAGHSAGAHIAAMLALDRHFLASVEMDPRRHVRGLLGLSGPYDFLPLHSPTLKTIFGPESTRVTSQPVAFASAGAPPALLLVGARDQVVEPGNTIRMAERLRAQGCAAETIIYPRLGHAALVGAFASPLRWHAPVLRDSATFLARVAEVPVITERKERTQ